MHPLRIIKVNLENMNRGETRSDPNGLDWRLLHVLLGVARLEHRRAGVVLERHHAADWDP